MSLATDTAMLTLADLSPQVASMVTRSLSWKESRPYMDETRAPSPKAHTLLARWKKLVTMRTGDPAMFSARLATLGINEEEALQWLGPVDAPSTFEAPEWSIALDEILSTHPLDPRIKHVIQMCESALQRAAENDERPIFIRFLAPFLAYAFARIEQESAADALQASAQEDLALAFAREFSWVSARTIAHELKKASNRGDLHASTSEDRYREFVDCILPSISVDFLLRNPVLARMMSTLALQFVSVTVEVLHHLQTDIRKLSKLANETVRPVVRSLRPFLSDFHNGGHSVWQLEIETIADTKVTLFHKPRSLRIDEAWSVLIAWLADRGHQPALKSATGLDCGDYGWSLAAIASDCISDADVRTYFRRQGGHTALITALGGQDFHAENFIAAGAFPIPIDLEGLFAPIITAPAGDLAQIPLALAPIQYSGAGNLMLPYFRRGENGKQMYSASGVAGTGEQPWPQKLPTWSGLNTDQLHLSFEFRDLRYDESLPTRHGIKVAADAYGDEIVEGIRSTWKFLADHRDELVAPDGPLAAFRGCASRTLFRDTQQYAELMFWTTAPDILESGTAYDVALETLAGAVPFFCNGDRFPEIVDIEKEAFWHRDIPMAETRNDDVTLHFVSGEQFGPVLGSSAWAQAMDRLPRIDTVHAEWQAAVASSLLHMTRAGQIAQQHTLLDAAIAIGNDVCGAALQFGEDVSWLTFTHAEGSNRVLPLQTQPWDLTGNAGNAIFLAELARITGDAKFAELARKSLVSAESTLEAVRKTAFAPGISASAFAGSFGLVYAMLSAGRTLHDSALLDDALRLALSHDTVIFERETNPDWLTGVAGTLAVIARLYEVRPHEKLRAQALQCNAIIHRTAKEEGRAGWQVPYFDRTLLGIAHGSSGIAAALASAHTLLQEPVGQSIVHAFEHERPYFQRDILRWPNLQHDTPNYMTGWCAGPAGFGMARLLALRSTDETLATHRTVIEADLKDAIAAAQTCAHAADHHACCGDAGTIQFLAMAAKQLGRPDLATTAKTIAEGVLRYRNEHALWLMQGGFHDRIVLPGLLSGQVSIGMAFLAAIDPSTTEYLALC